MPYGTKLKLSIAGFAILILVLPGCSTDLARPEPAANPLPLVNVNHSTDPPGLPVLDDASPTSRVRAVSESSLVVNGDSFIAEYGAGNRPGETFSNGHIIAPGGDDDLAWAKYAIGELDIERPAQITFTVTSVIAPGGDDDLPLCFWIGTTDYSSRCWKWSGPYTADTEIVLNSATIHERCVSAENQFQFIVVVDGCTALDGGIKPAVEVGYSTTLVKAQTDPQYFNTAPLYAEFTNVQLGSGGKSGSALDPASQYVTLTWVHYADAASKFNEASKYEIFRWLVGSDEPIKLLGKVDAPGTQFTDPLDVIPVDKHPVPGATYIYYLDSINIGGKTPLAASQPVTIPLLPPTALAASDGSFPDRITLSWTRAEGATQYEIYRDSQDEPVVVVGDVETWDDLEVSDQNEHVYWLRSVNEYAHSDTFSASDTGYRGAP